MTAAPMPESGSGAQAVPSWLPVVAFVLAVTSFGAWAACPDHRRDVGELVDGPAAALPAAFLAGAGLSGNAP